MKINKAVLAALVGAAVGLVAVGVAAAGSGGRTDIGVAMKATAQFHAVAVAEKHHYGLLRDAKGIACIDMTGMPEMGAMGIHYANGALVKDPAINAGTPEALVYQPLAHGKLQLVAVEYVVLKAAWDAKHSSPPSLFGQKFNFTPAGNRFGLPAYYSLHAWLWKHNPSGEFSMWNPTVSCPKA